MGSNQKEIKGHGIRVYKEVGFDPNRDKLSQVPGEDSRETETTKRHLSLNDLTGGEGSKTVSTRVNSDPTVDFPWER